MGPNRFPQNVSKKVTFYAAYIPKRAHGSFTSRRKPVITHCSVPFNTSLHLPDIVKMDSKYVNTLGPLSSVSLFS